MDANTQKITAMLDKMTIAGWIARSVSRDERGTIQRTGEGKTAMQLIHLLMFDSLKLQPGDESVFAWLVFNFPAAQRRVSEPPKNPPSDSRLPGKG
jgi:hypothetical protein